MGCEQDPLDETRPLLTSFAFASLFFKAWLLPYKMECKGQRCVGAPCLIALFLRYDEPLVRMHMVHNSSISGAGCGVHVGYL